MTVRRERVTVRRERVTARHREGDVRAGAVKGARAGDDTAGMVRREGDQASGTPEAEVLRDEPLLAGGPAGRCAAAVRRELAELPLPALRRRRDLLAAELRRVQHWNRLVRARRDLLVATACGPEELAVPVEAAAHGGPLEVHLAAGAPLDGALPPALSGDADVRLLDPGAGLRALVLLERPAGSGDLPARLQELTAAQRRLEEYAAALEAERGAAAEVLAERLELLLG
ncbi:hypothetical protein GTQ99_12145 [Kineococcus sp. T13]|uniref:hypothetical protein n=1 Tax=Kineococcus vitellinus TaxID=2696565 RepID=UPI0014131502|nr:hypothetical protein [Kineococcus vitellinus]NAZ76156.1 hypothetical protein [Kineococcus vitellinus]